MAKDDGSRIEKLQRSFGELRQGLQVTQFSETAQDQIRRLLSLEGEVACTIAQARILDSLAFEEMHGRYDMVDEAHSETFNWIFSHEHLIHENSKLELKAKMYGLSQGLKKPADIGDVGVQQDEEEHQGEGESSAFDEVEMSRNRDDTSRRTQQIARVRLTEWLSSGEGIFHVSGKLGSGKSTLMKYLYNHPKTELMLKTWAGKKSQTFCTLQVNSDADTPAGIR
jgi:hypothetical protein